MDLREQDFDKFKQDYREVKFQALKKMKREVTQPKDGGSLMEKWASQVPEGGERYEGSPESVRIQRHLSDYHDHLRKERQKVEDQQAFDSRVNAQKSLNEALGVKGDLKDISKLHKDTFTEREMARKRGLKPANIVRDEQGRGRLATSNDLSDMVGKGVLDIATTVASIPGRVGSLPIQASVGPKDQQEVEKYANPLSYLVPEKDRKYLERGEPLYLNNLVKSAGQLAGGLVNTGLRAGEVSNKGMKGEKVENSYIGQTAEKFQEAMDRPGTEYGAGDRKGFKLIPDDWSGISDKTAETLRHLLQLPVQATASIFTEGSPWSKLGTVTGAGVDAVRDLGHTAVDLVEHGPGNVIEEQGLARAALNTSFGAQLAGKAARGAGKRAEAKAKAAAGDEPLYDLEYVDNKHEGAIPRQLADELGFTKSPKKPVGERDPYIVQDFSDVVQAGEDLKPRLFDEHQFADYAAMEVDDLIRAKKENLAKQRLANREEIAELRAKEARIDAAIRNEKRNMNPYKPDEVRAEKVARKNEAFDATIVRQAKRELDKRVEKATSTSEVVEALKDYSRKKGNMNQPRSYGEEARGIERLQREGGEVYVEGKTRHLKDLERQKLDLDTDIQYAHINAAKRINRIKSNLETDIHFAKEAAKAAREQAARTSRAVQAAEKYKGRISKRAEMKPSTSLNKEATTHLKRAQKMERWAETLDKIQKNADPISASLGVLNWGKNKLIEKLRDKSSTVEGVDNISAQLQWMLRRPNQPGSERFLELLRAAEGDVVLLGQTMQGRLRKGPSAPAASEEFAHLTPDQKPTALEVLAYEKLATDGKIRQWVDVDRSAPPQQRFKAKEGAPKEMLDWVETAKEYDWLLDVSRMITREHIAKGLISVNKEAQKLLDAGKYEEALAKAGLDASWLHHAFDKSSYRKALRARLEKQGYPEADIASILRQHEHSRSKARDIQPSGDQLHQRTLDGVNLKEQRTEFGLKADVDNMVLMGFTKAFRDVKLAEMWQELSKDASAFSDVHQVGWLKERNPALPNGRKALPGLPDEFWVHPDVGAILAGNRWVRSITGGSKGTLYGNGKKLLYDFNGLMKRAKTAFEPASHATNLIGNLLFFGPVAGINIMNPAHWKFFKTTAREMIKGEKSPLWQQFVRDGGLGPANSLTRSEVYLKAHQGFGLWTDGVMGRVRRMKGDARQAFVVENAMDLLNGQSKFWKGMADDLQAAYLAEDNGLRFTLYAKLMSEGVPSKQAIAQSRKAFGAYEDLPGLFTLISHSPLGVPFVAFPASMIPKVIGDAYARPGTVLAASHLLQTLSDQWMLQAGLGRDELEKYRDTMPEYHQNTVQWLGTLLGPDFARSGSGNPIGRDAARHGVGLNYVPRRGESLLGLSNSVFEREGWGKGFALQLVSMAMGRHPFFKKELESGDERIEAMGRSLSPSWVPGWGHGAERVEAAMEDRLRYLRDNPESVPQAVGAAAGGISTMEYGSEGSFNAFQQRSAAKVNDVKRKLRSALKRHMLGKTNDTPEELLERLENISQGFPLGDLSDFARQAEEGRIKYLDGIKQKFGATQ